MYHNLISLPPRNVIQERLDEISEKLLKKNAKLEEDAKLQEDVLLGFIFFLRTFVYDKLLQAAGKQLNPQKVATLVGVSIEKHITGVPPLMKESVYKLAVPAIIDALVIDKGDAWLAKELFARNLESTERNRRCEAWFGSKDQTVA